MIQRKAKDKIREMAQKFPILVFTGPRQSGKTTLSKMAFPEYRYVSLENPDNLAFAQNDPRGFLAYYDKYAIIDEAQNAPQLFSYIQQVVDEAGISGQYILSGSQNYLMLERITQSLAGRVFLMDLLPLSSSEIKPIKDQSVWDAVIYGGYPRIYDKDIAPSDFFPSYIQTYIERDVRSIINVQDLSLFRKFLDLCAAHAGQVFNANKLSKSLGIGIKTVQSWLSILETSYIAFTLPPWFKNFSKRVVKSPKLYFYDTGLLAYLLGIENKDEIITSSFKGALFENYAIVNIMKHHKNRGLHRNYYYWRDSNGNEIDFIVDRGAVAQCIEMKASQTVKSEFLKSLHYLDGRDENLHLEHYLMNTLEESQKRTKETILSWKDAERIV